MARSKGPLGIFSLVVAILLSGCLVDCDSLGRRLICRCRCCFLSTITAGWTVSALSPQGPPRLRAKLLGGSLDHPMVQQLVKQDRDGFPFSGGEWIPIEVAIVLAQ